MVSVGERAPDRALEALWKSQPGGLYQVLWFAEASGAE